MSTPRYSALLRYIGETPWAMLPSTLYAMRDIIAFRLAGGRLTAEEVEEVIGARKPQPMQPRGGAVAVLPLWGMLSPHTVQSISSGGTTALDSWCKDFQALVDDDQVASIVLDVDSPGGAVDLVPETAALIRQASAKKRVVAVANTRAASAAYWLACQAGELVVSPSGAVGSIGVFTVHEDISAQLEGEGVDVTLISAGPYKTEGNPYEPLGDEAKAAIQQRVDATYRSFLADVGKGRGVDATAVEANYGQGRMLLAADAVKAGMADRVATLDQVVAGLLGGAPGTARPTGRARALAAQTLGHPLSDSDGIAAFELAPGITFRFTPDTHVTSIAYDRTRTLDATAFSGAEIFGDVVIGGPVPAQSTETVDEPWDGPAAEAKLNTPVTKARGLGMYGWYDDAGDDEDEDGYPDAKADWKFPHHVVGADGEPHAANVAACRDGLARLDQAEIPDGDRTGVRAHLQRHIDDFDKRTTTKAVGATSGDATTKPKEDSTMQSMEELVARLEEIQARKTELDAEAGARAFTADEQTEFDALCAEDEELEAAIANIKDRKSRIRTAPAAHRVAGTETRRDRGGIYSGNDSRLPENVFDLSAYRGIARGFEDLPGLYRDGALKANERLGFESDTPDKARDHVERLLRRDGERAEFATRVLGTSNPLYERAFGKLVLGHPLNTQEKTAMESTMTILGAISEGGLGAETPVPVTIDPSVMLTSDGATNPLRALARVVSITGLTWRGISSAGVVVGYGAELAQVADDTPAFDAPDVSVVKAQGYVEFSTEVDSDWPNLRTELAAAFTDARDVAEANKFLLGTGVNEPEGLIAALVTDATSIIQTVGVAALALTDLDLLTDGLPPRFDANAGWLGSKTVFSKIRQLANANGNNNFWIPMAQGIRQTPNGTTGYSMLDYPVSVASEMSKQPTTTGQNILLLGDYSRGYVIVDRIGMNVELIPQVMGANQRPKGARALYVTFRNNGQLRTPNAFRLLQVK